MTDLVSESIDRPPIGYHHAMAYYVPGDVIPAGNWGRTLQGFGAAHTLFFRETVWEMVRAGEFADRPSTLSSAYFYDDLATAQAARSQGGGLIANLYEVQLVNPEAPVHRADLGLWESEWLAAHTPKELQCFARRYWQGAKSRRVECLTTSALRVIEVIERSRSAP